jgi:rhamnosyltransferase
MRPISDYAELKISLSQIDYASITEEKSVQAPLSLSDTKRVSSITVAYNPNPLRLAQQVAALRGQVDEIIIIDNGSEPSVKSIFEQHNLEDKLVEGPRIKRIALQENQGIASGFNVGIEEARREGAEFVLLLDHDSIPAANMVSKLMAGYLRAVEHIGKKSVAAVGPRIVDSRDARDYPFIRLGWLHNRHIRCRDRQETLVECDFLISSGSLIPIKVFSDLGEFDDALFIDSVDLEWCCRARARQFSLYGVCETQLDHLLGDQRRIVFSRIKLMVHSPSRIYYMTRNRIMLYQRRYMPLKWKLKDALRMLAKFAATMTFIAPRLEYLRMTIWAIRDAIAQRGGRLRIDRP